MSDSRNFFIIDIYLTWFYRGAHSVMVISEEMDIAPQVQILDKTTLHIALTPLKKALFFLQLWVKSWPDWALWPWCGDQSKRRKTLNSNQLNSIKKTDLVSYHSCAEGLGKYIYRISFCWSYNLESSIYL